MWVKKNFQIFFGSCLELNILVLNEHMCAYVSYDRSEVNFIEAAATGAANAIVLVANIAVNLIAFYAILHFINATLSWFGARVGAPQVTYQVQQNSYDNK